MLRDFDEQNPIKENWISNKLLLTWTSTLCLSTLKDLFHDHGVNSTPFIYYKTDSKKKAHLKTPCIAKNISYSNNDYCDF